MKKSQVADDLDNAGLLINNQQDVESLQRAVLNAPRDVNLLRSALRRVLEGGAWLDRLDPHRGARWRYRAEEFIKFIHDPLPEGLATDEDTIRRFLDDDKEALVMFEQAVARGRGGNNNPAGTNQHTQEQPVNRDNVTVDLPSTNKNDGPPRGNTMSYAVRRLSRERPDLVERVKTGELSAHRAMVEAGLRKAPSALEQGKRAFRKMSPEEQQQFSEWIAQQ